MICKHCQLINHFDNSYPLRKATRDLKSDFPRCDWHWRFVCSICGRPRHFNGIAWCEKTQKFICISCARSHKLVHCAFWKWKSYYVIECKFCHEYHPTLDYLEFIGKHPWQIHINMQKKRQGLSQEIELPEDTSSVYVSWEKAANEKQISQAWDKLAEQWIIKYTEYGDLNRKHVVDPTILRVIGGVKGLSILDAGCGNGYLCRILAKKGARVAGVDISKKFIEIAKNKEKEEKLGIKYYVASVCNLSMFSDEKFDLIVSNLVLMDLQDLDTAIKEFQRVLKKGGKLVFSIMHPCFSSPPIHGWVKSPRDTQRKEDWLYWKVDRYFDRSMEIWQFYDWLTVYSFHRPLSDYMNTLIRNNFVITNFEEPVPSKKAIKENYREFGNEYERIPWFLVIGAKKQ